MGVPDLREANLIGADLREVNFSDAKLNDAKLRGANLCDANLKKADLSKADLSVTYLSYANLSGGNLIGADLRGANLNRADLSGADLSESILSGADLHGANLIGVESREANLSGADLREANLSGADLHKANLSGANFRGANLNRADLSGADLSGSYLELVELIQSNCQRAILTGVKTYAWNITDWKIGGVECEYIFTGIKGEKRLPLARNFKLGEFEKLFKQLPTIEYYFENGITPVDVILMDKIVAEIRDKNPEFEIEIQSVERKGLYPCFKFIVKHEDQKDKAFALLKENKDLRYEQLLSNKDAQIDLLRDMLFQTMKIEIHDSEIKQLGCKNVVYNEYNITIDHLNDLFEVVDKNETLSDKVKNSIKDTIQGAIKDIGKDGIKEGLKKIGVILKPHLGTLKDAIIKISPELWKYYLQ